VVLGPGDERVVGGGRLVGSLAEPGGDTLVELASLPGGDCCRELTVVSGPRVPALARQRARSRGRQCGSRAQARVMFQAAWTLGPDT
jgi:hypothetical protein